MPDELAHAGRLQIGGAHLAGQNAAAGEKPGHCGRHQPLHLQYRKMVLLGILSK